MEELVACKECGKMIYETGEGLCTGCVICNRLALIPELESQIKQLTRRAEIAELAFENYFGENYEGHMYADDVFQEYIQKATEEIDNGTS